MPHQPKHALTAPAARPAVQARLLAAALWLDSQDRTSLAPCACAWTRLPTHGTSRVCLARTKPSTPPVTAAARRRRLACMRMRTMARACAHPPAGTGRSGRVKRFSKREERCRALAQPGAGWQCSAAHGARLWIGPACRLVDEQRGAARRAGPRRATRRSMRTYDARWALAPAAVPVARSARGCAAEGVGLAQGKVIRWWRCGSRCAPEPAGARTAPPPASLPIACAQHHAAPSGQRTTGGELAVAGTCDGDDAVVGAGDELPLFRHRDRRSRLRTADAPSNASGSRRTRMPHAAQGVPWPGADVAMGPRRHLVD